MPSDKDFEDNRSNKKECSHCHNLKEYSEFYKNKSSNDGYHLWCKKCFKKYRDSIILKNLNKNADSKEDKNSKRCGHCKQVKPISEFNKQISTVDGYYCFCKECVKESAKIYANRKSTEEILADPENCTKIKKCKRCKEIKTLSEFHINKNAKDYHRNVCKQCRSEDWALNKEVHSKNKHERYLKNKDKVLEASKKRYEEQKEKILPVVHSYYQRNREKILAQKKEYRALERVKENSRIWHQEYNITYAPRRKQLAEINKEHINELRKKYRKTFKGKLQDRRKYARRKRIGFKPLNSMFPESDFHHMYLTIDGKVNRSIGLYIPHVLHRLIFHNPKTGQGMKEINKLALIWLSEQSII